MQKTQAHIKQVWSSGGFASPDKLNVVRYRGAMDVIIDRGDVTLNDALLAVPKVLEEIEDVQIIPKVLKEPAVEGGGGGFSATYKRMAGLLASLKQPGDCV